jgi:hypothetical protein
MIFSCKLHFQTLTFQPLHLSKSWVDIMAL